MAKTTIPQKTQSALWARAGGRCQYRGCNEDLVGDLISGREDATFGFIAHIVGDSVEGPRGDAVRSPQLARSLENLLCIALLEPLGYGVGHVMPPCAPVQPDQRRGLLLIPGEL